MMRLVFIFFLLANSLAFGQRKVVEGMIVDANTREPIPFASIGILGTPRGTSSNLKGEFSLAVEGQFAIRVSCLGYETQEVQNLSAEERALILLKPSATQLKELVVFNKQVNPKKVVRKAFNAVNDNLNVHPFVEKFFYRHYCKDDSVYGRLIEASVDVWKRKGYKTTQQAAGERDEIRVTQLRRSFDKTEAAQGHVPIAVNSILQADIAGYQTAIPSEHLSYFTEVSNLQTDIDKYTFTFEGLTTYDGKEVYEIAYTLRKDSVLTTSGYQQMPRSTGSLFITTKDFVFVKTIDIKSWNTDTVTSTAYYTPFNGKYYPYHLIRDGKTVARDKSTHWYHVELMASEILTDSFETFYGKEPGKRELVKIPYDSAFWNNNNILKTTPLEDQIIYDLGGGSSLNRQFYLYQQEEKLRVEAAMKGEEGFTWLREDSKGKRVLLIGFWSSKCGSCMQELEAAKKLMKSYKEKVTFVLLSLDEDESTWQKSIERYNLALEGFMHFRVGANSGVASDYKLTDIPRYILIDKNGADHNLNAKHPGDPQLKQDLDLLLKTGEE
jgi:thiol-disulfide isomerase/thioredoxin